MVRIDAGRLVEPAGFDAECRRPGNEWLAVNEDAMRLRDYWSRFKGELAEGFAGLCAYSAMYEPVGTVDHFVSTNEDRRLAYEWTNYRFASAWINSSKSKIRAEELLDPLLVGSGWFRILLPSLQLEVCELAPEAVRSLAQTTIERLHLVHDERIMRQRRQWYKLYVDGMLSLDGLQLLAPLIADAVRRARGDLLAN